MLPGHDYRRKAAAIAELSQGSKTMPGQTVRCPKCGAEFSIKGSGGRKPYNMPVKKVYDSLENTHSIAATARELGCSRAYIYGVLKEGR